MGGIAAGLRPAVIGDGWRNGDGNLGKRRIDLDFGAQRQYRQAFTRQGRILAFRKRAAAQRNPGDSRGKNEATAHETVHRSAYFPETARNSAARARTEGGVAGSSASRLNRSRAAFSSPRRRARSARISCAE